MSGIAKREPPVTPAVYEARPQTVWIDDYLDGKQSEISEYVKIVLEHWRLALAVALAVFAAAGVWTYTTKPLYTSSVNIQIDPEQAVLPYKEVYDSVTADPRYLLTQGQVLKSEALARRIVTQLNLASASDSDQVARQARGFASRLVVTPVENTQVVKVSYRSEDPVFAARAVNTLADEYANYSVESKRDSNTKAKEFLGAELSKQKQKLEQSEQALVQYSRAHNMLLPSDGTNAITQKLNDLNREMTKVEAEVIANQYQALKGTTLDNFPEGLKTNVMRDLESRRSTLELKLATLTVQFGPKWPEVITLGKELADVRQQLVNGMRRALEQANAEYNLSVAHRERLATALAAQSRLADQLTQDSIQYNILKREVDTDRQIHEGLLQRLKETDVSAGLKSGNVHVIDRGYVATRPSSPNVPLNLALGLTLGLLSGVMCAFAVEYLDQTVASPEDVERDLRLPFLGAIPAFAKSWKDANGGLLMPLNGQRPDSGRHLCECRIGRVLGKLSGAEDIAAVFVSGTPAARHSRDVGLAWGGKDHDQCEPRDRPGANRGSYADSRTRPPPAQAGAHACGGEQPGHESLPRGSMRVEHRNSADRDPQSVRGAVRADSAEPARVDWLVSHGQGARVVSSVLRVRHHRRSSGSPGERRSGHLVTGGRGCAGRRWPQDGDCRRTEGAQPLAKRRRERPWRSCQQCEDGRI